MPYFFGSGALTGVPFARAAAYLRRARATRTKTRTLTLTLTLTLALALPPAPILTLARHARASHAAYAALCSDETTLARTNLRYAAAGATPRYGVPSLAVDAAAAALIDGTDASTCERWAAEATAEARREAAGRLAARPACVAAFARRCATLPEEDMYPEEYPISPPSSSAISPASSPPVSSPSSSAISPASSHDTDEDDAVCDALRAVASLLLLPPRDADADTTGRLAEVAGLRAEAAAAAAALRRRHGSAAAADAAAAVAALSVNVGVPRDMEVGAARALRSHARLVADALRNEVPDNKS